MDDSHHSRPAKIPAQTQAQIQVSASISVPAPALRARRGERKLPRELPPLALRARRGRRGRPAELVADAAVYALLLAMSALFLYPLWQVAVASVSDPNIVLRNNGLILWPQGLQFDSYRIVFSNKNIGQGFANTVLYMVAGTAFQYVVTLMAAFVLSKKNVMGKKPILLYMMFTMYFSGGLIPHYLLISSLGLMNSRLALIIPYGVNVWNIIIMRTNFASIPDSLSEAAYMDGASDFSILFRVLLPLSGAVSAVLILFTAVFYWNMWFDPMIYMTDRAKYPLQSFLREILISNDTNQLLSGSARARVRRGLIRNDSFRTLVKYAIIIVSTVPILALYPFLQRYFIKGVMVGSLKE
jgi:putative aldouronate transport system permease protein